MLRSVEEAELSFAWVSLDEQDDDPIRLWRHVVEALRQVVPDEEFGADVIVGMGAVGQSYVEATLPTLINGLAELSHRVVLVLDDYHYVSAGEVHESVAFFVEHLPENFHLLISSRSDPPLPLGRLRATGEMNEFRTEELAFSEEEADCLLNERMNLSIGPDDLSFLLERTEGWPAGIYLASLSLQNKENKHAFIDSFGGSNRYVVGFLGEEILSGLDEEMRRFVLETSVLRTMTGPLCDAVTGREDSTMLLRELARSNLFVVSLDEQGEWYRYHRLFSGLLLYELRSSQPDLVPALRRRASEWLEGAGYIDAAIRQAITAEDFRRVGLVIARHWFGYAVTGHAATVERWLESLPEGMIAQDAALCLVEAWICALSGRREKCEEFLALAEGIPHEGSLPGGTASVEAGVVTLRATFAFSGIEDMAEAARRADALGLDLTSPQAPWVKLGLGLSWYFSGNLAQARKTFEEGLRLTDGGRPLVRVAMLSGLSFVAGDERDLEEAESLAREARAGRQVSAAGDPPDFLGADRARARARGTREAGRSAGRVGERLFRATEPARPEPLAHPHEVACARAATSRAWRPSWGQGGARRGARHPGGFS